MNVGELKNEYELLMISEMGVYLKHASLLTFTIGARQCFFEYQISKHSLSPHPLLISCRYLEFSCFLSN